ncbi:MAG TPA: response regulator [Gemmatimonadaceae bacterium]|jgi:DNA-binding response OmpR family regulator
MTPPTILIVDDSRENADILRRYLDLRGYATRVAHNADQALALFDTERPALVLLDVLMPGRDGWAVCRAMREHPHGARSRIVMLTGLGTQRAREETAATGADELLAKPVDLSDLLACVRRNLGVDAVGVSPNEMP